MAYFNRGNAWSVKGDFEKAVADYSEGLRIVPDDVIALVSRGNVWVAIGEFDKAMSDYNEAIRLDPNDVTAYIYRGLASRENGDFDQAIADFGKAIRLAPQHPDAYDGLAWIQATAADAEVRDGEKAVENATKACELTGWQLPICLGTLAAAHAEVGQFDKAIERQKQAIELAPEANKADFEAPLALYSEGKPYRDE